MVFWGPVIEADVALAALRAAGVQAQLIYQSSGPGAFPGPGPTDSRVLVPNSEVDRAAEVLRPRSTSASVSPHRRRRGGVAIAGRLVALGFLALVLWAIARTVFGVG